jgi:hypothetical protein
VVARASPGQGPAGFGAADRAARHQIHTSATSNMAWTRLQLQRWNGASWDQVGEVLDAASE